MRPTPKKTLEVILTSGNDYLVALKSNQPRLYRQVKAITNDCQPLFPPLTVQTHQRGRLEQRCLRVFSAHHINAEQWPQVRTLLCIDRQTTRQDKATQHRAYYISSVATAPSHWMHLLQGHWSIENRLHWPKDVVLGEDDSYGRNSNALLNASVFRSIVIN